MSGISMVYLKIQPVDTVLLNSSKRKTVYWEKLKKDKAANGGTLYWVCPSWISCPHSSPQSVPVLCTGGYKDPDNTPVFWLLLNSAGAAPALTLQHSTPIHKLGVGKKTQLGPNWLKGLSMSAQIWKLRKGEGRTFIIYKVCPPEQQHHVLANGK